jgi:hypothetical protein
MGDMLFPEMEGTTQCGRCRVPVRVNAERRNPDAQMLRLSKVPKGMCVNCAVTEWLMNTYPINMQIEEMGYEALLNPGIQEMFGGLMESAKADARPDEINWELVVANWHLPLNVKRSATNPYLPGDALREKLSEMEYIQRLDPLSEQRAHRFYDDPQHGERRRRGVFHVDELDELEPGLGRGISQALKGMWADADDKRGRESAQESETAGVRDEDVEGEIQDISGGCLF